MEPHARLEEEEEDGGGAGTGTVRAVAPGPKRNTTFGQRLLTFMGAEAFTPSVEIHRANRAAVASGGKQQLEEDPEDEEAANEHRSLKDVPLSVSSDEMIVLLGKGVAWYFRFLKFICAANAALFAVGMVSTVPHLVEWGERPSGDRGSFPSMLYLSSFSSNMRGVWTAAAVCSVVAIFFMGPLYRRLVVQRWDRRRLEGDERYVEDPFEGQYRIDSDECVDRIPYDTRPTHAERAARLTASLCIFCAVIVLQGVINFYLQQALRSSEDADGGGGGGSTAAVVLSFTIVVANVGWKFLCKGLTHFERHLYYSDFRRYDVLKVFVFKVFNILTLYFVKRYEVLENTTGLCPLFLLADQAFWLLVVDITVMNVVELAVPALMNRLTARQAELSEKGNDAYRPDFDLAEEYLEVVYRQLLVGLGSLVVPALPGLALLGNAAEYYLDKYRLLRVAAKPKRTNNNYSGVLLFFFFVVGVAVLVSYPNGAVWLLSAQGGLDDASRNCAIFQS